MFHPTVLQIQQLQPQFLEKPKISEENLLSGVELSESLSPETNDIQM